MKHIRNCTKGKYPQTAGRRLVANKAHDEIGSINEMNAALNKAMGKMGIRTDGQLMRANYLAGVGRRSAKGRPPENNSDIV
jgi:hypothetical protein